MTPAASAEDRPFASAEAIRSLENRIDCCRELFRTRMAREGMLMLSQPGNELGKTVVDLYRMNCRGGPTRPRRIRLACWLR